MELKTFIKSMPKHERPAFAARCGTTVGFLRLLAYKAKPCSPELAVALDRESSGLVPYRQMCPEPKMDWSYLESKSIAEHETDAA